MTVHIMLSKLAFYLDLQVCLLLILKNDVVFSRNHVESLLQKKRCVQPDNRKNGK